MPATTYVAERQVEYWTSRQIEEFFLNGGYSVLTYPLGQRLEKYLPADFLFGAGAPVKLFGIQYKALYTNGRDFWRLARRQHQTLALFPWIYYGFSELRRIYDFRNSLHYLRLLQPDRLAFLPRISRSCARPYTRWPTFYERLSACTYGVLVETPEQLADTLLTYMSGVTQRRYEEAREVVDFFALGTETRAVVRLSPQLRDDETEESDEQDRFE